MRDNGSTSSSGSGGVGAHIKPVHWSRTEHQLTSHEGFAPEAIKHRDPAAPVGGDGYTKRLAEPPKWTQRNDLPCTTRVPKGNQPDLYDTNDEKRAKALCAGCPVKRVCLDEAMGEERGLSWRSRWLVRGGLTPAQRAARDFSPLDKG